MLREQLQRTLQFNDALLYHDDLAEISTPLYFHEFVAQAGARGLQFLSEADLFESQIRDVPEQAGALMASLPKDVLVHEQYLDFFKNRMFRQTLLCAADAPVRRHIDTQCVRELTVSSAARPQGSSAEGETFAAAAASMTTVDPLVAAAMHELHAAWPQAISVGELAERSRARLSAPPPLEAATAQLCDVMLEAHLACLVVLRGDRPPLSARPPQRPLASSLAREQLRCARPALSTLLHTNATLQDELERELLPLLDGTRDRAALAAACQPARPESAIEAALLSLAVQGLLSDRVCDHAPAPSG